VTLVGELEPLTGSFDAGGPLGVGLGDAGREVEPLGPGDGVRPCKRLGRRAAAAAEDIAGLGTGDVRAQI